MANYHLALKHKIVFMLKHLIMYIDVNKFLIRLVNQKDKDRDKGNLFLLVIPEKYETIILHTYHDSLLAGHQGPYRRAMTIRQKFFIHNLMDKVERYIEVCHTCLKTKSKYMKIDQCTREYQLIMPLCKIYR